MRPTVKSRGLRFVLWDYTMAVVFLIDENKWTSIRNKEHTMTADGLQNWMTPAEVKELLRGDTEYALIDVREEGDFSRDHQLLACSVPLSRLDVVIGSLVPCRSIPVIVTDGGMDGETLTLRAKQRLRELGYSQVYGMQGGLAAWKKAGYHTFAGVFVPSKAFGEFVEHRCDTPRFEPQKVSALLKEGRDMVILDSRPNNEYRRMNIPTARNVPGGELVYHIADLAPDPKTLVVVNCAGRTRSIIGAQSLRNAGIPNEVVALKGGTMNWELSGLTVERGTKDRYSWDAPSAKAVAVAKERAAKVAERYNVRFVDQAGLNKWKGEEKSRTLYVFDVRQPGEFAQGHMPGSRNVQGVTLVQSTDTCVGVRNARIVVADDTEVRAIMAASWLVQMGYPHVYVLRGGIFGPLEKGDWAPVLPPVAAGESVSPDALQKALGAASPPLVLDLGNSRESRKGHVPGAAWVVRSELGVVQKAYPAPADLVLVCDDGLVSRMTADDAAKLWPQARIQWLEGGTKAWKAAGLPLENGLDKALCAEIDVYNRPYEGMRSKEEERAAMIEYLSWEEGLVEQVEAEGDLHFFIK